MLYIFNIEDLINSGGEVILYRKQRLADLRRNGHRVAVVGDNIGKVTRHVLDLDDEEIFHNRYAAEDSVTRDVYQVMDAAHFFSRDAA